jgi:hypothetical protein
LPPNGTGKDSKRCRRNQPHRPAPGYEHRVP